MAGIDDSLNLRIRLARRRDARTIAERSRRLIEYALPRWSWTPRRVAVAVRHPETTVIVAEAQARLAGFAIMEFGMDTAHLSLLGVDLDYRRRGIGRGLVRWLEKAARVAGTPVVNLEVRAANTAARAFYRHLGYRDIARLPRYYCGIEEAVRMARDLWIPGSEQANEPGR